ncbi:hypothetical protein FRX31_019006, partial [Thalictrum thalictroides]
LHTVRPCKDLCFPTSAASVPQSHCQPLPLHPARNICALLIPACPILCCCSIWANCLTSLTPHTRPVPLAFSAAHNCCYQQSSTPSSLAKALTQSLSIQGVIV